MFNGTVNHDYLYEGLLNKTIFLDGFKTEVIVHADKHLPLPVDLLEKLQNIGDVLLIRKHTDEPSFNDWNYHRALSLATGDLVMHFDQDTACFTTGKEHIEELISHLDNYKFVSYPSHWTPNAVHDPSFGHRTWASTRFFICKRETLKLDELEKCIDNPEWGYEKYGDSPRRCNWTEHYLTLINEDSCFYPPIEIDKGAIFSWGSYKSGTLKTLNDMNYKQVKEFILSHGGLTYPNDLHI